MNYTVTIEGPNYVIRDSLGSIIAQSADFVTMMNSLSSVVKSGETVLITDGTYPVGARTNWSANGSTILGISLNAIIRSLSTYISSQMMIFGSSTNHITIDKITFDNNLAPNPYPPILDAGAYNTVQNCQFLNIMQYGLLAFAADHFQLLNNYSYGSQYGISTGGGLGYPFSTNGLIQRNIIKNSRDSGIKLRWCNNVTAEGNDIDVAWKTWMNGPASDQNPSGITFYSADGPNINVIAQYNNIHNSGPAQWTSSGVNYSVNGIYVMPDVPANWSGYSGSSSGMQIIGNLISGMYRGVRCDGLNVIIKNNKFIGNTKDIIGSGSWTATGNLYDKTGTGRRKIATSSNLASGTLIIQGFVLVANEVVYTEQGSVIVISAKAMAGYSISAFRINGVDYAPDANGLYSLTVGAQDYTVQAVYVTPPPPTAPIPPRASWLPLAIGAGLILTLP